MSLSVFNCPCPYGGKVQKIFRINNCEIMFVFVIRIQEEIFGFTGLFFAKHSFELGQPNMGNWVKLWEKEFSK